ncbi:hypothetical protein, partial [Streptomyces anulatus]|uniref:hypothetical protein n=1 Tax=Streptomyces anulatus TaxID=1892 RepID=UPI00368F61C0
HHQFRFDEDLARTPSYPAQVDAAFQMYLHRPMRLFGRQLSRIGMAVGNFSHRYTRSRGTEEITPENANCRRVDWQFTQPSPVGHNRST